MTLYHPRTLVERILEAAVMLFIAAYLIKLAVGYVVSVRLALIIIGSIVLLFVIGFRLYHYFIRHNNWKEHDDEDE